MALEWISIATADGTHLGKYQVTDGLLIVRFGSQERTTRASTAFPDQGKLEWRRVVRFTPAHS
jgi:hypothetical protein